MGRKAVRLATTSLHLIASNWAGYTLRVSPTDSCARPPGDLSGAYPEQLLRESLGCLGYLRSYLPFRVFRCGA